MNQDKPDIRGAEEVSCLGGEGVCKDGARENRNSATVQNIKISL